jgi:Protein of unknown function DUF262/Methylase-associated X1
VLRIVQAARGALSIEDDGDGWPTLGTLSQGERTHTPVALYVGVMGDSHRGRGGLERRFQNPGQDRPIHYHSDRRPLLLGVVLGQTPESDLLVGFNANRRLGRRTRFSMFASEELVARGRDDGWAVGHGATGEELVVFAAADLARYLDHRFGTNVGATAAEVNMAEIETALADLAALIGCETTRAFGHRLATELAAEPAESPSEIFDLIAALGRRERLLAQSDRLDWDTAVRSVAVLDDRLSLMLSIWDALGPPNPVPRSHRGFVTRIYEDHRFLAKEGPDELDTAVLEIAKKCDPELTPDDLDVYYADGRPTLFLYESVRSFLEAALDERATSDADDDYGDEDADESDDEDEETIEQVQPVNASVDKLQVIQIFNLVEKGRLDIRPPWQRKDVWSLKRKRELIKSLILGIPLPSIILHNKGGRHSIIDGKQRLTAIIQFLRNEWKLPNYPGNSGSPLDQCRNAFYFREGKPSLTDDVRDDLELRSIPTLIFHDVPEPRLRKIFELYNVAGMKLNAAEIRNAVYQSNPVHQTIYILAGESDSRVDVGLDSSDAQRAFSERLRAIYPGARKRYQGVDFLARYLGYSRAVQRPGADQFRVPSTSAAINNFFDYQSPHENSKAVARELAAVMDDAEAFFDLDADRLAFFLRNSQGKRQFNKLLATTNMVAARFLRALIDAGEITDDKAKEVADSVATAPPEKQQRATIWDYQARILVNLRDKLGVDVGHAIGAEWKSFFEKMEYCLLPEEPRP